MMTILIALAETPGMVAAMAVPMLAMAAVTFEALPLGNASVAVTASSCPGGSGGGGGLGSGNDGGGDGRGGEVMIMMLVEIMVVVVVVMQEVAEIVTQGVGSQGLVVEGVVTRAAAAVEPMQSSFLLGPQARPRCQRFHSPQMLPSQ